MKSTKSHSKAGKNTIIPEKQPYILVFFGLYVVLFTYIGKTKSKLTSIMDLLSKYASVFRLGKKIKIKNGKIDVVDGKINMVGIVNTPYERNELYLRIKSVGGEKPNDFRANIKVLNKDYYHLHRVKKGETLTILARKYYRDPRKYIDIYNANRDQIRSPNKISINQKIIIPNV